MPYIYDSVNEEYIEVEIVPIHDEKLPLKRDGWNFTWNKLKKEKGSVVYALRTLDGKQSIEGLLLLKGQDEMLIMDLVEIAPHNIGSKNKRYEDVAGCLIAFACRESFKIQGAYQGFVTFTSKSELVNYYRQKYGAQVAIGRKMYIDDLQGERLIERYLERKLS